MTGPENGVRGGDGLRGDVTVKSGAATVTGGNGGNGGSNKCDDITHATYTGKDGGNGGNGVSGNVTVESGSATVTGGNGGTGGINLGNPNYGGKAGAIGQAVGGTIKGTTAQESDDNSNWTDLNDITSGVTSDKMYVKIEGVSHTHSFTYSARGATITAKCTEGCPDRYDTNGIKLTLSAPESLTNGTAKAASISGYPATAPDNLAAEPTAIAYYKSTGAGSTTPSGAALDGAPANAGDYVAQMTWGGETASVAFSIKAASDAPTPGTDGDTLVVGDVESKDVSSLNNYLEQYKDQPEQLAKIEKLYFDDAKTLTDLNGVEKLTNVKQVTVIKCPALQSADLSGLTKLEEVAMNNCESLKVLDVSNCSELTSLDCSASEIELLKMDGCPKLAFVDCSLNSLGYLDMSKDDFPKLVSLDCHGQTKDGLDPVQSNGRWVVPLAAFTTPQPELEAGNVKLASVNNVILESVQGYKRVGLDDVKIETTCSSTGIVSFASSPEWMVYNYNTGFENVSMDVTVMGTEKTDGGSSSSSSGCGNDPWWVLLLAPLPFLF